MDTDRAARIQALTTHPAFIELRDEIDHMYDSYTAALAKKMMADGHPYSDFEYKRGYLAGLRKAVRYPDTALKILERDLTKQTTEEEPVE